jgi:hypothetical protein
MHCITASTVLHCHLDGLRLLNTHKLLMVVTCCINDDSREQEEEEEEEQEGKTDMAGCKIGNICTAMPQSQAQPATTENQYCQKQSDEPNQAAHGEAAASATSSGAAAAQKKFPLG